MVSEHAHELQRAQKFLAVDPPVMFETPPFQRKVRSRFASKHVSSRREAEILGYSNTTQAVCLRLLCVRSPLQLRWASRRRGKPSQAKPSRRGWRRWTSTRYGLRLQPAGPDKTRPPWRRRRQKLSACEQRATGVKCDFIIPTTPGFSELAERPPPPLPAHV